MADTSKINPIRIDKLGEANGVASLDNSGKVPDSQLPEQVTNAVKKTGDTMTGPLIVPDVSSGSNDNTVINSKWANGLFVKKAGDTMSGDLIIKKSFPLLRGAATSDLATTDGMCLALEGKDANNKEFARIDLYRRGSIKQSEAHLIAENSSGTKGELAVFIDDSGRILTFAPTPASTSNTTEIATTGWVRNLITQESTKFMALPNTKAGIDFTIRTTKGISDTSVDYTIPDNGIFMITGVDNDDTQSVVKVTYALYLNNKGVGSPVDIGSHIYQVLKGDIIHCGGPVNNGRTSTMHGVFFPYL